MIGARSAQDIPDFRFPDSSVYEAADRICEEIYRKQAICSDETLLKGVVSASHDHSAGHIATDEKEIRLVNRIDISIKAGAFLDKMDLANSKQPLELSELQYCNVFMKTECGVKTVRFLKDSGAQISLIQRDLIKDAVSYTHLTLPTILRV